jgi:hypothetical protein
VHSTLTIMAQKFAADGGRGVNPRTIPRCIFRPWKKAAALCGAPVSLADAFSLPHTIVTDNWCLRCATRPASVDNIDALRDLDVT